MEIILIAAGVFVLVSILGIILLMGVGLQPPARKQDAESYPSPNAWEASYSENHHIQPIEAYHDEDESFVQRVRRRSLSLAGEFKQELINWKRGLTVSECAPEEQSSIDRTIADVFRKFSFDSLVFSPRQQSDPEDEDDGCKLVNTPISVTGRENQPMKTRRRSTRPAKSVLYSDLEAQNIDDSLL